MGNGTVKSVQSVLRAEFYNTPSPPWPPHAPPPPPGDSDAQYWRPPPPPSPSPPAVLEMETLWTDEASASAEQLLARRATLCRGRKGFSLLPLGRGSASGSGLHAVRFRITISAAFPCWPVMHAYWLVKRGPSARTLTHARTAVFRAQWWRWEWQAELEQRYCGSKEWLQPYASLYRDTMKTRKLRTVLGNKKSIFVM
jgi:hypothetical protein